MTVTNPTLHLEQAALELTLSVIEAGGVNLIGQKANDTADGERIARFVAGLYKGIKGGLQETAKP